MFARVSLCLGTKGSLHSGNLEFYSLKLSQFELHTTYSNICSSTFSDSHVRHKFSLPDNEIRPMKQTWYANDLSSQESKFESLLQLC